MNIVIPTIDYPPIEGGIGTLTLETARALTANGHDVTVIAPWFPDMESHDDSEPYSIVRFRGYGMGWLRLIPLWRATIPYLAKADHLIAINIAYGGIIGRYSARRRGVPYTALAYGFEFLKYAGTPRAARFIRSLYKDAKRVVAISEFTRTKLAAFGVGEEKIRVHMPGAPTAPALRDDAIAQVRKRYTLEGHRVILSVGRMILRKNQVALVRALPRILEQVPDALLVIVGRGPEMHQISRTAVDCGVREHLLLPGRVDDNDLAAMYSSCDVFALPNKETDGGSVEGFGLVFTEAGVHGKPVVAGNSGGAVEAVVDGETGIVVDGSNDSAITEALIAILTDADRARAMGEAGRARAMNDLSWTKFASALIAPDS